MSGKFTYGRYGHKKRETGNRSEMKWASQSIGGHPTVNHELAPKDVRSSLDVNRFKDKNGIHAQYGKGAALQYGRINKKKSSKRSSLGGGDITNNSGVFHRGASSSIGGGDEYGIYEDRTTKTVRFLSKEGPRSE
jgi:hypothetical protein